MASFELSEAADRDLTGIYRYSYGQFGARQVDACLLSLEQMFLRD